MGNITYYQYSKGETIISSMDPLGRETVYYMNERYLPSKIIYPGYRIFEFEYNEQFLLSKITDPQKGSMSFTYDKKNQLLSLVRPDGSTIEFYYNPDGKLVSILLPQGLRYGFSYNKAGKVQKIKSPNGLVTTYTYDKYGMLKTRSNNRGLRETYHYDGQGRLVALKKGKLKIRFQYLDHGRKIKMSNNAGVSLEVSLDAKGRVLEYKDPRGKKIRYSYHPKGKLSSILYPNGAFTSLQYDANLNLTSLIDPAGRVYSFGYDGANRRILRRDPSGKVTKYVFNKMDLESVRILPNGDKIEWIYDHLGRPVKRITPEGEDQFAYNPLGRLVMMKNKDSHYKIKYDSLGRPVLLEDLKIGARLTYTYNKKGLRSSMTGPFGTVRYEYDSSGRIKAVIGPRKERVEYLYNPEGQLVGMSYPNGVTTIYDYDILGRLTKILTTAKDGTIILKRQYKYNKQGVRSEEVNEKGHRTHYVYDLRGQLLKVSTSKANIHFQYDNGGNRVMAKAIRYRYDSAGNRIALQASGTTTYAYDPSGRIVLKGKIRYLYDDLGNLTKKIFPDGTIEYSYSSKGKLRKVKLKNGKIVEFGYAPNGARVWKKSGKSITRYLYDFEDVVAEFKDGKLVAYYLHGPGIDEPLGMFRRGRSPQYYHRDGQGSVAALTDKSGKISAKYAYGPFGELIQEWGFHDENPYRFSSRWYDKETGLYYQRSRYYDPSDGRFTSPDPALFGGGINLYAYCGNDPVNYVDPYGTSRSLWGFVKDVGRGAGLLLGFGPDDEVAAARESFLSSKPIRYTVAFGKGFGKGVWSGVVGIYNTVRHPIQTAKAIYNAVDNFSETKEAIGQLIHDYVDAYHNDPERFSEMTGNLVGQIAFAVAGTKGLDKLGKISAITKLRGMSKVAALRGVNRIGRFGSLVKASRVGRAVSRLAPAGRVLANGYQKIGGAYISAAGRKIAPWLGKKIASVGRGYWKFGKKAAIPTIVAFHDRIDKAVNTYGTFEKAGEVLNENVSGALKRLSSPNLDAASAEDIFQDIDTSFDNYRDFLYKPVHEADMVLKKKMDELADLTNRGKLDPTAAESRLRKFLFDDYPKMRLSALEDIYLKNKPDKNYHYIKNGKVNTPSINRIATYDHQIELYKYIKDQINDPRIRASIDYRIAELEKRKEADMRDFLEDKEVNVSSEGMSDGPEPATPGMLDKLDKMEKSH
ncbi:MAG: RHS repeat protein [Planctomycetota bacterium]|nr:MAG: RHS repeat protein [Planctomycetota bacterium]